MAEAYSERRSLLQLAGKRWCDCLRRAKRYARGLQQSAAQTDLAYPALTRPDQRLKWCDPGHKNWWDRCLHVTVLVRVSENEAYLSAETQPRCQLRLYPTQKPPQEPLTVGRIFLRKPVENNRIGETGR